MLGHLACTARLSEFPGYRFDLKIILPGKKGSSIRSGSIQR